MPELDTQVIGGEPVTEPVAETEPTQGELVQESVQEPVADSSELPPDGVMLDRDGDLHVGEKFYGELGRNVEDEIPPSNPVSLYTPDEIAQTHFSQIDANRLPEQVRPYLTVVQQRLQQLEGELAKYQTQAAQTNSAQVQAQIQQQIAANAPKPYTPDEIAAYSKKLTAQQLGVADPDELDFYDPKVIALQAVNAHRLDQARQSEISEYSRQAQGEMNLRSFYSALTARPEYKEFDQYLARVLNEQGVTPAQFVSYLNGNNPEGRKKFAEGYAALAGFYQSFMQSRSQVRPAQSQAKAKANNIVPFVESAGSGTGVARKPSRDLRNLSAMSDEEQAEVFKEYGLV